MMDKSYKYYCPNPECERYLQEERKSVAPQDIVKATFIYSDESTVAGAVRFIMRICKNCDTQMAFDIGPLANIAIDKDLEEIFKDDG